MPVLRGVSRGDDRNRTGVHGFAGRCVTTPPRRREGCKRSEPGAGSAAAHQPADGRHQLVGLLVALGVLGAHHAVVGVVVEQAEGHLVERGLEALIWVSTSMQ